MHLGMFVCLFVCLFRARNSKPIALIDVSLFAQEGVHLGSVVLEDTPDRIRIWTTAFIKGSFNIAR